MFWPPFVFASVATVLYFHVAKKVNRLRWPALILGFVVYIIFGYIGEFVNHALYPEAFRGIGDNPAQVGNLIFTIFISVVLVPVLYKLTKKKRPEQTPQPPSL